MNTASIDSAFRHEDAGRLQRSIVAHYESALRAHGPTARGMDWKDEASQRLRFSILCEICDLNGKSIHEVGAGAGHLYDYLKENQIDARYSGSDLSAEMVRAARERHPDVQFEQKDILIESDMPTYDVLVCSGLFHVKLDHADRTWQRFVQAMVHRMYEHCRVGLAFNMITDHVGFKSDDLYYSNPGETIDFCRQRLSRYVTVRHDYPLYEYTTYVYANTPDRATG